MFFIPLVGIVVDERENVVKAPGRAVEPQLVLGLAAAVVAHVVVFEDLEVPDGVRGVGRTAHGQGEVGAALSLLLLAGRVSDDERLKEDVRMQ